MTRWGWLAVATVAFVAGVAGAAGAIVIGLTDSVVTITGIAILLGALAAYNRTNAEDTTGTPEPEQRLAGPAPGRTLEDALAQFRTGGWGRVVTGERIQADLREAAVTALVHFDGDSRERAQQRVQDGRWTDDQYAAAFLGDRERPSTPVRERVATVLGRFSPFERDVSHTIAAIASIGTDGPVPRPSTVGGGTAVEEGELRTASRRRNADAGTATETNHWAGIGAATLLAVAIGVILRSPTVVLVGVVGFGYVAFSQFGTLSSPPLTIERAFDDESPAPGDDVEVTVTVRNDGDGYVPDLRLVDGVPPGLSVSDGSPRLGTALRPGEEVTLTYSVEAERGTHEFDPALALVRNVSRSSERELYVPSDTTMVVEPRFDPCTVPIPLRTTTAMLAGRMATREGGSGLEFHSVREYRRNDPLNRIDWNRHARTGELATLQFREERAVTVVVLIDTRQSAYLAPPGSSRNAVDRSIDAAGRVFETLLEAGDTVGIAAIGPDGTDGRAQVEPCWLGPGTGDHHRERARRLLATHPQLISKIPTRGAAWRPQLRTIKQRLPDEAQIVYLSPLCDGGAVGVARWFDANGHAVTVISPDPTAAETSAQQLAGVGRRVHVADLQAAGIPVVDWRWDESLDAALARASARSSAGSMTGGGHS